MLHPSMKHINETESGTDIVNSFSVFNQGEAVALDVAITKTGASDPQLKISFPDIPGLSEAMVIIVDDSEFKSPRISSKAKQFKHTKNKDLAAICTFPSCQVQFSVFEGTGGGILIRAYSIESGYPEPIDFTFLSWEELDTNQIKECA
tara:strand:- start:282 stop:725 length:444 start_codon:yes stop_codon:yes gene_type:complete